MSIRISSSARTMKGGFLLAALAQPAAAIFLHLHSNYPLANFSSSARDLPSACSGAPRRALAHFSEAWGEHSVSQPPDTRSDVALIAVRGARVLYKMPRYAEPVVQLTLSRTNEGESSSEDESEREEVQGATENREDVLIAVALLKATLTRFPGDVQVRCYFKNSKFKI